MISGPYSGSGSASAGLALARSRVNDISREVRRSSGN